MSKKEKYISQNELDHLYKDGLKVFGKDQVEKIIKESGDVRKSVFLCHSHLDKTIVSKISYLLKKLETEIYIDWLDKTMPTKTNKITASTIRERIDRSNKFLFLATYHGLRSKWCMWELGIADTLKGNSNLAILPIESKTGNWSGSEYLQLYPEMRFKSNNLDNITEEEVFIQSFDGQEISLKNWLSL